MASARESAFEILQKMERDRAYSTVALRTHFEKNELTRQDVQLASALVFGVTERKLSLDYFLSLQLSQPLKKLKPQVLTILRIGAYQLLYMDKIPPSAAVNEAVKSAKKNGCAFAAGLVNAVLRKVASFGLQYPKTKNKISDMSIFYSCPEWLVSHFVTSYGEENAKQILASAHGAEGLYISVNTNRISVDALEQHLALQGVETERIADLDAALLLKNAGDITGLYGFAEGLFHVQDYASQLCCAVLDAQPGDFLVDCCAAPGGKTFTSAYRMKDTGRILSCDIHPFKTDIISENAKRLQIHCVETVCLDAVKLAETVHDADRVLCDVPCSGFGVIGRKPEIRYKDKSEADALPALQIEILTSCARMVKKDGILVYSTCTLNPAENEDVCLAFLKAHPEFESVLIQGMPFLTVLPDGNHDGFFIAKMKRSCEESL